MTRKRRRLWILLACGLGLGSATALVLTAFSDNLVFFVSPSDLAKAQPNGRTMRLGGLVEQGSVQRVTQGKPTASFKVTDGNASVQVTYVGLLPDLFREGQGVVTLGVLQPDNQLTRFRKLYLRWSLICSIIMLSSASGWSQVASTVWLSVISSLTFASTRSEISAATLSQVS